MEAYGEFMNLSVITIFIISAFSLFSIKYLQESCKSGTLEKRLLKFAKNALRVTYIGVAAVGVFCLALFFFPVVRFIGFAVIPTDVVRIIRKLMMAIFEIDSVYAALQILASTALFAVGFSLIFSIFGFVASRVFVIFRLFEQCYVEQKTEEWKASVAEQKRSFGKIFLHFAHLRI